MTLIASVEHLGAPMPDMDRVQTLMARIRMEPDGDTLADALSPESAWVEPDPRPKGGRAMPIRAVGKRAES